MGVDLYFESQRVGPADAGVYGRALQLIRKAIHKKADKLEEASETDKEILEIIHNANEQASWMNKLYKEEK